MTPFYDIITSRALVLCISVSAEEDKFLDRFIYLLSDTDSDVLSYLLLIHAYHILLLRRVYFNKKTVPFLFMYCVFI